jgi:hypothetical protein
LLSQCRRKSARSAPRVPLALASLVGLCSALGLFHFDVKIVSTVLIIEAV